MAVMVATSSKPKPRRRRSNRSSCSCFSFTACFGISGGVSKSDERNSLESFNSGGRKMNLSWLSWSRFRIKKSASRTVPVDSSSKELQAKDSGIVVDSKETTVEQNPAETLVIHQCQNQKAPKVKNESTHNRILNNQPPLDVLNATCPKPKTISRKTEPRSSYCQPGSLVQNLKCRKVLRSSQSLPSTPFNPRKKARLTGSSQAPAKKPASQENERTGKFDPTAGLLLLMITLTLLLIFGRIGATLCLSVWFYAGPGLLAIKTDNSAANGLSSTLPDFNSEEYKKRVILEGLLERNHRHAGAGIS